MKINDIKKIIPLKKEEISLPLEELSEDIHYCNLVERSV